MNARRGSGGDIVLIARTDALQSLGYKAAVSRLNGSIKLGAEVAFLEGITSKEQARQVCEDVKPNPGAFQCGAWWGVTGSEGAGSTRAAVSSHYLPWLGLGGCLSGDREGAVEVGASWNPDNR